MVLVIVDESVCFRIVVSDIVKKFRLGRDGFVLVRVGFNNAESVSGVDSRVLILTFERKGGSL